jgi:ATP-binding cassette subfamily B protein
MDGRVRSLLFRLFKPYLLPQGVMLAAMVVSAMLGAAPAIVTARIIDADIPAGNVRALEFDTALVVGLVLLGAAAMFAQGCIASTVSEKIMRDVRVMLADHLHRMPLGFFVDTHAGTIMNRVSGDVDAIEGVVNGTLLTLASNTLIIAVAVAAMFVINWRLSLIALLALGTIAAPLVPASKAIYQKRRASRETRDCLEGALQETLSPAGITLLKNFAREEHERERLCEHGGLVMQRQISLAITSRSFFAWANAVAMLAPALIWFAGGFLSIATHVTIGTITAFVALVSARVFGPALALSSVQSQIAGGLAVFERIAACLDLPQEAYLPAQAVEFPGGRAEVLFEDVVFAYPGKPPVLKGITLEVPSGGIAAVVGASGSGKSTLTYLLARLYEPQAGRITIGGIDIARIPLAPLRANIGMVSQETYLFHDTLLNNLRYANLDATESDIRNALEAAHLLDVVERLPRKLQTTVGHRGIQLSGGERQRVALARVFLQNPPIVVLDEPTSALDAHSEAAVQRAIATVLKDRTTIIIAHRLSTVRSADVIYVLQHGQIVEKGSHDALCSFGGAYASLLMAQSGPAVLSRSEVNA